MVSLVSSMTSFSCAHFSHGLCVIGLRIDNLQSSSKSERNIIYFKNMRDIVQDVWRDIYCVAYQTSVICKHTVIQYYTVMSYITSILLCSKNFSMRLYFECNWSMSSRFELPSLRVRNFVKNLQEELFLLFVTGSLLPKNE